MTGAPIRVFVVDDHEVVRLGLRAFLGATTGVELVGEAPTAARHCTGSTRSRPATRCRTWC